MRKTKNSDPKIAVLDDLERMLVDASIKRLQTRASARAKKKPEEPPPDDSETLDK